MSDGGAPKRISEESVEESLADLDRVVAKMRETSARSVAQSESAARDFRDARPSRSNPNMRAVRASQYSPEPITSVRRTKTADELAALDPSDLTSRFNILKRGL